MVSDSSLRGCIDLIMTDSLFIEQSGILNDFVSDHYIVYCIRKKKRENHETIPRLVHNNSAFDKKVFENLLVNSN